MLTASTSPTQTPQKQEIDHKSIKNTRRKVKGQAINHLLPFHISSLSLFLSFTFSIGAQCIVICFYGYRHKNRLTTGFS